MNRAILVISLLFAFWFQPAHSDPLQVSTVTRAPFSMIEDGRAAGFSVDLVSAIAERLGRSFDLVRYEPFAEMLSSVAEGQADLAIANISITAERERQMDFSQPIFEAGLQIMVPLSSQRQASVWQALLSVDILIAIAIAFVVLLGGGMLMWVFERRAQPYFDRSVSEAWFPSFWWALNLVVNGGFEERVPRTVFGRMFGVLLVISSLFVVSVFVAKITSVMTVTAIQGAVNSVNDLYGQRVATIEGSTAARFLERREIDYLNYPGLQEMLHDFETGKIAAVVFDAPVLSYYVRHNGAEFGAMAGPVFRRENYGIAFPSGSPLVEEVNRVLLELREDGTYDAIYRDWFGVRG